MKKRCTVATVGCLLLLGALFLYFRTERANLRLARQDFKNNANIIMNGLGDLYLTTKRAVLLDELDTVDAPGVFVFGDSIVERMYFPSVCGLNVFNAGISGARATESGEFLGAVLDRAPFRLMVLSMGTNDASRKLEVSPEAFSASYDHMVQAALDRKIRVILVTIPPLEESRKEILLLFDPERIAAFNERIMAIGKKHGLTVVDVNSLILSQTAERHDSFSVDGVHLNPTYARFWREAVYAAVRTALADAKSPGQ
jgi:lysophospholipase L1-like esterase